MTRHLRWLLVVMLAALLLAAGAAVTAWVWVDRPLALRTAPAVLEITPGMTARQVATACVQAGIDAPDRALYAWFRGSGDARRIRAGNYEIPAGTTPRQLLRKLVDGDETLARVRLIEGWTLRQVRRELARAEGLKPDSAPLSEADLMRALGAEGGVAEGRFFPDTYSYTRGSSDLAVLRRALVAMNHQLEAAWAQRDPGTPLRSAQDLLTLASIVEKETGRPADRARVAAVFTNRLRIDMPLQTDPSVIYGLGDAFDGNLRKRDLLADGPYNTYTRRGLPPTPIALPGRAALWATARPESSKALYFVARGDGSSEFSESLAEHNRAVQRFQRQSARP